MRVSTAREMRLIGPDRELMWAAAPDKSSHVRVILTRLWVDMQSRSQKWTGA
ncbi:MAG: hypothetical protein QOI23_1424 [Chloroflexota bacterium]|nr:hypothetical protein [Chloroflexota bacterium]